MTDLSACVVLIVEDGDEYLDSLSRYVPGPRYLQAKSGAEALSRLESEPVDLVYLDMRFDRTDPELLLGDLPRALQAAGGDAQRALGRLALDQGLHILAAIRGQGYGRLPVILAYDFSRELARFGRLSAIHAGLTWVPDDVTPEDIRGRFARLLAGR